MSKAEEVGLFPSDRFVCTDSLNDLISSVTLIFASFQESSPLHEGIDVTKLSPAVFNQNSKPE